ncbi:hypothetical protein MCERE10_01496 [Burkholderiaceae bacterium]
MTMGLCIVCMVPLLNFSKTIKQKIGAKDGDIRITHLHSHSRKNE